MDQGLATIWAAIITSILSLVGVVFGWQRAKSHGEETIQKFFEESRASLDRIETLLRTANYADVEKAAASRLGEIAGVSNQPEVTSTTPQELSVAEPSGKSKPKGGGRKTRGFFSLFALPMAFSLLALCSGFAAVGMVLNRSQQDANVIHQLERDLGVYVETNIDAEMLNPSQRSDLAKLISESADPYSLGIRALATSDYPTAERQLRQSIQKRRSQFKSHLALSRLFQIRGMYSEAVEEGRSALKIEPDDTFALRLLATVLLASGNAGEAEVLAEKAAGIAAKNKSEFNIDLAKARMILGGVAVKNEDSQTAAVYFHEARAMLDGDPFRSITFAMANYNLATVLSSEQAITFCKVGLSTWDRIEKPHGLNYAKSLMQLGVLQAQIDGPKAGLAKMKSAVEMLDKARPDSDATLAHGLSNYALFLIQLDRWDDARYAATRGAVVLTSVLYPERTTENNIDLAKGMVYRHERRFSLASASFKSALESAGGDPLLRARALSFLSVLDFDLAKYERDPKAWRRAYDFTAALLRKPLDKAAKAEAEVNMKKLINLRPTLKQH